MTEHTRDLIMIAAGGAAGSVARHMVGRLVGPASHGGLPWHTLVVNVSGALTGIALGRFIA